jgi:hypothetical protein
MFHPFEETRQRPYCDRITVDCEFLATCQSFAPGGNTDILSGHEGLIFCSVELLPAGSNVLNSAGPL